MSAACGHVSCFVPPLQKELKKLAKAQGQGLVQAAVAGPNTPAGIPTTPGVAPPNGTVPVAAPPRTTTPRPGVVKPPPAGIGTPHSVSTPAPAVSTPAPTQQHPPIVAPPRGVKREREESGLQVNGNIPPTGADVKVAKAGVPGVRPRPVKKPRLVRHCDAIAKKAFLLMLAGTLTLFAGCKWAAISAADPTCIVIREVAFLPLSPTKPFVPISARSLRDTLRTLCLPATAVLNSYCHATSPEAPLHARSPCAVLTGRGATTCLMTTSSSS